MNAKNSSNVLDFEDPGTMGEELLAVPGFVNELMNYTLAVSPRPNPPLAFAGALAMLTHLTGRSYVDERGGHTNLYLAALAPTAMGKEEPRDTNKKLATAAGILATVPDAIASGEGLEDAVALTPSLLLQTDEADALLTAMRGTDSRSSKMNEMVLRFFSEAKSGHAMRLKAGETQRRLIPLPHLTLFATGIPKFVYGALSAKALENGLLGRCLFVETNEFRPLAEPQSAELPANCVTAAKAMAARERKFNETYVLDPVIAVESAAAKRALAAIRQSSDETAKRLFEGNSACGAALWCRLYEKVAKLATLSAISRDIEKPEIAEDDVAWANGFATYVTRKMLYEAQFNVADNSFDRLKKRVLRILARHGGQLDHSRLLKSMGIEANLLRKVVNTLLACDQIESETLMSGKQGYVLRTAG